MNRTMQALNTKPLPRTGEQLFKNYAELFFDRNMPKGGVGRKRNMGDLRAFLNWAGLDPKYFDQIIGKKLIRNAGFVELFLWDFLNKNIYFLTIKVIKINNIKEFNYIKETTLNFV